MEFRRLNKCWCSRRRTKGIYIPKKRNSGLLSQRLFPDGDDAFHFVDEPLAGSEGFAAEAIADGGATATKAGSHPYQLAFGLHFKPGGEFEDQPGAAFPDGDLRDLGIELPPGLILNAGVVGSCSAVDFATPRNSPFQESASGESCPVRTQIGIVTVRGAFPGGERTFGLFNLAPPPGFPALIGANPFGTPITFAPRRERVSACSTVAPPIDQPISTSCSAP